MSTHYISELRPQVLSICIIFYHHIIIRLTFFLLQCKLQVILDHTGPHSADTVVTL